MFKSIYFTKWLNRSRQFPALPFQLQEDNITRLWMMSGLFLLGILAVLLPAYYFDPRLLNGAPVWLKPIKFALSLAIHFFTLAILAQQIAREHRIGLALTLFGYAAVASMLLEQIYISIQAGRAQPSHFNIETAFESNMYKLMGIGAFLLVTVSFILGVMIWKYGKKQLVKTEQGANIGLRLGSILGLILGSVLTLIFAGYMSSTSSHLVGQIVSDAQSLALTGWSRTNGDLRVPHFLVTHLIQILPFIGFVCDRFKLPAKVIVILSTLLLSILGFVLFFLAIAGQTVFPV